MRDNFASSGDDLGTFLGFGVVLISNSDFGDVLGSVSGTGNIDPDPLGVDGPGGDLHLTQARQSPSCRRSLRTPACTAGECTMNRKPPSA